MKRATDILRRLAGYPWRWCLRHTDALFKTDAEGRHVFFPNSHGGPGRIVPSEEEYARLRRRLTLPVVCWFLATSLVLSLSPTFAAAASMSAGSAIVAVVVFWRPPWTRWPVSTERLTLREVVEKSPGLRRAGRLTLVLSVLFFAAALFGVVSAWGQPGVVLPGVALMPLAVVGSLLSVDQIRWVKRARRGEEE